MTGEGNQGYSVGYGRPVGPRNLRFKKQGPKMRSPFRFAPNFRSGSRGVLHPPIANGAADGASWIRAHTRGAPRPPSHRSRPSPAPGSAVPKPILYGAPGAPYKISSLRVTPDGTGDGGPGRDVIGRRGVPSAARHPVTRSHGVLRPEGPPRSGWFPVEGAPPWRRARLATYRGRLRNGGDEIAKSGTDILSGTSQGPPSPDPPTHRRPSRRPIAG